MEFKIDRRTALKAGAALAASQVVPAWAQAQADAALLGSVLGQGHPRGHDQDVREGHRSRLHARGVLRRQPVQAGHRARRAAARQPGDGQHRAAGHLEAGPGVVDPDVGLPVPRRQSPERVLRERSRRADEEDGRGPAQGEDPRADVLRHAAGRPQAEEEDQYARRHGRHQAQDAARRRVAAPRPLDRRESHADGLCRDLHRPPDRRHRRPGQSAAQRAEHEVLRGDVADRADVAPGRLRSAHGEP